jgi:hypothetical protein
VIAAEGSFEEPQAESAVGWLRSVCRRRHCAATAHLSPESQLAGPFAGWRRAKPGDQWSCNTWRPQSFALMRQPRSDELEIHVQKRTPPIIRAVLFVNFLISAAV